MDSSLSEWNGRGVRQRLGLIVGLQFNDSETNLQQEWKTIFGGISNVPWTSFAYYDKALQKWRWKELSIGKYLKPFSCCVIFLNELIFYR